MAAGDVRLTGAVTAAGDVRLTGAVMAHPKRREAAMRLAAQGPGILSVVTDPDPTGRPSAFRTSLLAWSSIPANSTHHVLLHDDMALSDTFFERALAAAAAMPEAALALFAFWNSRNAAAVRMGALAGARWVRGTGEYTPVAALLLPRGVAQGYVEWAAGRGDTWPDDVLMGRYLREAGVPVYVAVPSLAEHEDAASLVDNDFQGLRRSPCFFPTENPGPDDEAGPGEGAGQSSDAGQAEKARQGEKPGQSEKAGHSGRAAAPREEARLDDLVAIPFFKRGVAQCAVRIPGTRRWRDIRCEDYLRGLGIDPPPGADPLWLTAFTMGVVHQGPVLGDPRVLDRALETMGPGGLCHELGSRDLSRLSTELHQLAWSGLAAGLAARPSRRVLSKVAVTGDATFVRDHVSHALTDHGYRLTTANPDIVVDVGDRRILVGEVVLHLGEPYGPGMPQDSPVAELVLQSSLNRPAPVRGKPVQLVHVQDIGRAVIEALTGPPITATIADPNQLGMRELAQAVARAVRPFEAVTEDEPPDPAMAVGDWQPSVDLDYGLHTYAQWLAYESDRQ